MNLIVVLVIHGKIDVPSRSPMYLTRFPRYIVRPNNDNITVFVLLYSLTVDNHCRTIHLFRIHTFCLHGHVTRFLTLLPIVMTVKNTLGFHLNLHHTFTIVCAVRMCLDRD